MTRIIFLLFLLVGGISYSASAQSPKTQVVGNQRAFYQCSQNLEVDTLMPEHQYGKLYFSYHTNRIPKNLVKMQIGSIRENREGFFVAFLVNTTDTSFHAQRQDGSLIMIQEAQDADGEWKPIEYWVWSGCGNSYFSPLELMPGECVYIPIRRYQGEMHTKIRLKMDTGKGIFYSEPFESTISKAQFEKETGNVGGILYHGPASYLDE